jgi:hypothetical protein
MKVLRTGLLPVILAVLGCSSTDTPGARDAQADAPHQNDGGDGSNDSPRDSVADATDVSAHDTNDTNDTNDTDAPVTWPPPGVLYLTKMTSVDDYTRLSQNRREVPFFIRRRGNDDVYPYPWNENECIFHVPISHLSFLRQIDPDRAVRLYYVDAKTKDGNLIPGRFVTEETAPTEVTVLFENTVGLMSTPTFTLEPTVAAQLRERFMRCVPFGTSFKFLMVCEDGELCPLP